MGNAQGAILTEYLPEFDRAFTALHPDEAGAGAANADDEEGDVKSDVKSEPGPTDREADDADDEPGDEEDSPGNDAAAARGSPPPAQRIF